MSQVVRVLWLVSTFALGVEGGGEVIASRRLDTCAHPHQDCSKTGGNCCNGGEQCYRKNPHWASCMSSCHKGIHIHDPPEHRTEWACTLISKAADTAHHSGGSNDEPPNDGSKNDFPDKIVHVGGEDVNLKEGWHQGMKATHFWDCEAGVCESSILQPFTRRKAVYAPANAPVDPVHHGGSVYGEKLWMTGAASDALSRFLGPNLYGHDKYDGNVGGCGQCVLVRNDAADNPHWMAVVMKKVRCHPGNPKCSGDQRTMDFAVPSFDHLKWSMANRCGKSWSDHTYLSREQSGTCGALQSPRDCDCDKIPDSSPELKMMREGCKLFKSWGWHRGDPVLSYKKVPCPPKMEERYSGPGGFDKNGVISAWEESLPLGGAELAEPLASWKVRPRAPWVPGLLATAALSAALPLLLVYRRHVARDPPAELLPRTCSEE